ncbi:hypothetical protein PtB15_7B666 [Puccinia triticina]|nr:hypothetical protein PtB15_7B666 [Puccinia triticina]
MASSLLPASSPMLLGNVDEPSRHFEPLSSPTPAAPLTHGRPKSCPTQHPTGVKDDSALLLKSGDSHNVGHRPLSEGPMDPEVPQPIACAQSRAHDEDLVLAMDTSSPSIASLSRMYNPIPPSHPGSNLAAMPLITPSNPYYMDISSASVDRSGCLTNVPAGVSFGTSYQALCEDASKLSIPQENRQICQQSRYNSPSLQATVGNMDIDSPGYNMHPIAHDSEPGCYSSSGSDSPLKQHSGRSASEGSIGKRSRMDEEEDERYSSSPAISDSRSCRHRFSNPSMSRSLQDHTSPLPDDSDSSKMQTNSSNRDMDLFSPEPPSSSSFDDASPCLNAVARKALYQAPRDSPLSAFRFPATKSTLNCEKRLGINRQARSSTTSSRSDSVPCRSQSKVAQNTATLFNRHLSLSTTIDVTRLEEPTSRRGMKVPRAVSYAASGPRPMEVDGRENSEELDDRSETDSSPVPRIAVKQVSAPTNLKAKRCAAPLDLGYLQPPSLNSVTALQSPSSRFIFTFGATIQSPVGIAFSEKERAGKILPCHKVSSDGLMRISPETMDKLLDGAYDDKISKKMIFDCRFGYEYDGGHIREAINLHDKEAAETMLLQGTLFNGGQKDVPIPSESGKPDPNGETKKVVLVFHCEYSAMRAPTVAKHLREQDRHKNMTHYPALHYPEIYILEGGFAKYFSHSPQHCDGSYVRMDDPTHRTDRQTDLNLFRTRENSVFARTKSYTYGDSKIVKHKKDPKLTLGGNRFGLENKSNPMTGAGKENAPARSKLIEEDDDDDDDENYAQASSPLYMTINAAAHAKRANLKTQGRSISMLAKVEQNQSTRGVAGRKPLGNKTQMNRLALA